MEFEAVDEGVVTELRVAEGSEGVKVGTVIALIQGEDDEAQPTPLQGRGTDAQRQGEGESAPVAPPPPPPAPAPLVAKPASGDRIIASPLAKRLAAAQGIDLAGITGSGPNGRIVKADLEGASTGVAAPAPQTAAPVAATPPASAPTPKPAPIQDFGIPHEVVKLSGMRKTIARRLTESKQQDRKSVV